LHRLTAGVSFTVPIPVAQPRVLERADDAFLSRVYPELLARFPLHRKHQLQLLERGLDHAAIRTNGYATLPTDRKIWFRVARDLLDRFGDEVRRVPGFVSRISRAGKPYISLMGWEALAGLLIPARGLGGQILGVKLRPDEPPADVDKYLWFAGGKGGTHLVNPPAHVPLGTPQNAQRVIVTEGELKSDVVRHLTGWDILSVPGVSNWKPILPVLQELQVREVFVAFDSDFPDKTEVQNSLTAFLVGLRDAGFRVGVLTWDPAHGKGLDDVLFAGHKANIYQIVGPAQENLP
jgi:hypothetical protein